MLRMNSEGHCVFLELLYMSLCVCVVLEYRSLRMQADLCIFVISPVLLSRARDFEDAAISGF